MSWLRRLLWLAVLTIVVSVSATAGGVLAIVLVAWVALRALRGEAPDDDVVIV